MSNIHGLNSSDGNGNNNSDRSGSQSDDDEGRQGFFVGGSDRSGQEVLGPPRDRRSDLQSRLFDAIQRAGAERLTPEQAEALGRPQLSHNASVGGGFRLGGHGIPSATLGTAQSGQQTQSAGGGRPQQIVHMQIWRNGFSLDDGPLRQFDDPQNRVFMQALMTKRIPPELNALYPGKEVDLRIQRKDAEYEPPKAKPFAGQGHLLGSVTPTVIGAGSSNQVIDLEPPPALLPAEETAKLVEKAQNDVGLDESKPITRIQIRFPDVQQPMIARFNHDHLVDQLRSFIVAIQPSLAFRPFQLQSVYPRKLIEDEQQSLKDAGMLNAAVTIRFVE